MLLHRLLTRTLIPGLTLLALSAGSGPAHGDILLERTYVPTSTIVGVPTSSVLSTGYTTTVVPTTYVPSYYTSYRYRPRRIFERSYYASPIVSSYGVTPTSYVMPSPTILPTTYVSSSMYLPTAYVSSSTYMPTTFVSSSFVEPTSFLVDTSLMTTSAAMCCETSTVAPTRTMTTRPPTAASPPSIPDPMVSSPSNERKPSATMNNAGDADDRTSSNVEPGVVATPVPPPTGAALPKAPMQSSPSDTTPPQPMPVPPKDDIKIQKPGETGGAGPATSQVDGTLLRDAQKPIFNSATQARNILRGRVVSYETRRPEEGVTVVVSSRTGTFVDRMAMSDADGGFKISLPEGDWTVKVKMPSGSILPVGRDYVTASNGMVTDASGRDLKDLLITR